MGVGCVCGRVGVGVAECVLGGCGRVGVWACVRVCVCVCAGVWCAGVPFTPPVGYQEVHLPATEIGSKLRKITYCQTAKNAKNSNFSSSNCHGPNMLTRTNATGFPVTLNKRTASLFEDRARRFLRMVVLFVVVNVDHEGLVCILVDSFSHVRRAFFCILVLREQNQVVDLVVGEHRLDST